MQEAGTSLLSQWMLRRWAWQTTMKLLPSRWTFQRSGRGCSQGPIVCNARTRQDRKPLVSRMASGCGMLSAATCERCWTTLCCTTRRVTACTKPQRPSLMSSPVIGHSPPLCQKSRQRRKKRKNPWGPSKKMYYRNPCPRRKKRKNPWGLL